MINDNMMLLMSVNLQDYDYWLIMVDTGMPTVMIMCDAGIPHDKKWWMIMTKQYS